MPAKAKTTKATSVAAKTGTGTPGGVATGRKRSKAAAAETEAPETNVDALQELEAAVESEMQEMAGAAIEATAGEADEAQGREGADEAQGEGPTDGHQATEGEEAGADGDGDQEEQSEAEDGDPEAEAEGEAEEQGEAGDEPTAEEEQEGEEDADAEFEAEAQAKGWPISAKRRLGKLLRRVKALQTQVAEAAEARESEQGATHGHQPRTVSGREAELQQEIESAEHWLDTIDGNPNGYEATDGKGGTVSYTPEQLRRARRVFDRKLRDAELELRDLRTERKRKTTEATARAEQEHAFLRDRTSREYQAIQQVLRAFPAVREIEDHVSVLADALAWRKHKAKVAKEAAAKNGTNGAHGTNGNGKPPMKPTRGVRPVIAPASNAAVTGRKVALQNATKRFAETGDPNAGRELIESILE